jgi:hypothetical protein
MRVNASPIRVTLQWGMPLTVKDGLGACITSRRGTVWITQDNDLRDVVLTAGESFRLERPETAIVQAMDKAEVLILPPAASSAQDAAPPGPVRAMAGRLLQFLRNGGDRPAAAVAGFGTPALELTVAGR